MSRGQGENNCSLLGNEVRPSLPSLLDGGLRHLCCSRHLDELHVLLRFVPQTSPGEDDQQDCYCSKSDDKAPIVVKEGRSQAAQVRIRGKQLVHNSASRYHG